MDIFERMRKGELILDSDPEYPELYKALIRGMRITGELNSSYHTKEETRVIIEKLTKQKIDKST